MPNDTINLLPLSRQRVRVREYWVRFATIALVTATWLVVVAGVLLIPSYVFLNMNLLAKKGDLVNIERTLSASDEKALLGQLKVLTDEAGALRSLKTVPSAVGAVTDVLSVPRAGVVLNSAVYSPAMGKMPRSVIVSGRATSRNSLQQYQTALRKLKGVSGVDLPVSAYAKDTEIPFAITVTLLP